jgi:predicted acetyltransferase
MSVEPTYQFRQGSLADLDAVMQLRRDCYPSSRGGSERFTNDPRFSLETDLVVVTASTPAGDQVVGSLLNLPLQLYTPHGLAPTSGIASVAIHPLYRRRGLAKKLVEQGLELGRRRGDILAALFAFKYAFYRQLGWGPSVQSQQLVVEPTALPIFPERKLVRCFGKSDQDLAASLYDQHESQQSRFAVARNPRFWTSQFNDTSLRWVGTDDGYLCYRYVSVPGRELCARIEILELISNSDQAFRALVGFLACLAEQITEIVWPVSSKDTSSLFWLEQVQSQAKMLRGEDYTVGNSCVGMLVRWLDCKACFELLEAPAGLDLSIAIQNSREGYRLREAAGQLKAELVSAETADLSTDLATLAQLSTGAVKVEEAHRWGKIAAAAEQLECFSRLFTNRRGAFTHELDAF